MTILHELTPVISVLGAILAWYLSERGKRKIEERKRREERYQILLESIVGFSAVTKDAVRKNEFIRQINLAWLYCPDEVIRLGYEFLLSVHTDHKRTEEEKALALGKFVEAIRRDMIFGSHLKKTNLSPKEFRFLIST